MPPDARQEEMLRKPDDFSRNHMALSKRPIDIMRVMIAGNDIDPLPPILEPSGNRREHIPAMQPGECILLLQRRRKLAVGVGAAEEAMSHGRNCIPPRINSASGWEAGDNLRPSALHREGIRKTGWIAAGVSAKLLPSGKERECVATQIR
jgi:hypothetical protein